MRNRIKSIFMCFILVVSLSLNCMEQAHAFELATDGVILAAVAGTALVAAGITFADTGSMQAATDKFLTECHDRVVAIANTARLVLDASTGLYKAIFNISDDDWAATKTYVDSNYDAGENYTEGGTALTYNLDTMYQATVNGSPQCEIVYKPDFMTGMTVTFQGSAATFTKTNGVIYYIYSSGDFLWKVTSTALELYDSITNERISYVNYYQSYGVVVTGIAQELGVTGEAGYIDNPARDWSNSNTGTREFSLPLTESETGAISIGGKIYSGDQTAIGALTVGTTYRDVAATDATGIATSVPTTFPQTSTTDETSNKFKVAGEVLMTKFPFCIPFDVMRTFETLQAPAVTPHWEIPFKVDSIGVNQTIVIDFQQFSTLASITRWFLSMGFLLGLILITRRLIM